MVPQTQDRLMRSSPAVGGRTGRDLRRGGPNTWIEKRTRKGALEVTD